MSAKGYNLAPPKVVIDEPIIYDSLVKDFKELVDEEVMQDRKETEKAWKAATKAAMEVKLDELEKLQLSYRDICEIDNLQGLKSLTYLCLDNNKIPEITAFCIMYAHFRMERMVQGTAYDTWRLVVMSWAV